MKTLNHSTLAIHLRQLPSATAFFDNHLKLLYASDRWHELFETSRSRQKGFIDQLNLRDTIWLDTAKLVLQEPAERGLRLKLDGLKSLEIDFRFLPFFGDDEEIQGLVVEARKVLPDMVKENALELYQHYEELSEIARIGYWEYYPESEEIYWSPMTRRIHGFTDTYVPKIEEAISFYKKGHSRKRIEQVIKEAIEEGTPYSERLQIVTQQGQELWVRVTGKCEIQKGGVKRLSGTFQDINEIVRIEKSKDTQEQLLQTLVDHLPLNVFVKDTESRKILVNKAECEYNQVKKPSEILGKSDFDLFDPEVALISREEDLQVMASAQAIINKETRHTIGEKTTEFLTSKVPYFNSEGKVKGIIGMSMDISNRKEQEREKQELLELTAKQNEQLMNFAHIVAHNLQSNASNIAMLIEFDQKEKEAARKQQLSEMLLQASDNLMDSLANLNELVNSSLKKPIGKKRLNLRLEVEKCLANLSAQINYHDIRIETQIPDNAEVKMAPAYLDSILLNLISNAIKYRKTNETSEIRLRLIPNTRFTQLLVEDNGKGVDIKKYGDKIFGLYKTFHHMENSRGIGLYLTKNQVENSGGHILMCSEEGRGATFSVYFPRP